MLTYSFSGIGSESLYAHLYQCIKNDILQGSLHPGERLPSKRSFAKHLNISTITVENAYLQLMAEGYINSVPKKGYYVADLVCPAAKKSQPRREDRRELPKAPQVFADFLSNRTRRENFPFSIWARLMREVISEQSEALMTNPPGAGISELRAAIAAHLLQFRGMRVHPEQIIIGAGTEYLYGLLIQLLGRERTFAVEDPGYQKLALIYRSFQAQCRFIPLDCQGASAEALEESGADVMHISPNHHFPTGLVTPIGRRYELLAWASRSENRYVIEDDYDCEFRLQGKPIPALQSIDVMEKVIYMNTFTKSLSPTIRISYMVLPQHLLEAFRQRLGFYACTVSTFEQYTLARFLGEGYFEKHINRMRNYYRSLRDALLTGIRESPMAAFSHIREEEAGLHFLLQVRTGLPDREIIRRAAERGVRISCLSQYYHEAEAPAEHTLILNYSGLAREQIPEAVTRLNGIFADDQKSHDVGKQKQRLVLD